MKIKVGINNFTCFIYLVLLSLEPFPIGKLIIFIQLKAISAALEIGLGAVDEALSQKRIVILAVMPFIALILECSKLHQQKSFQLNF